jgi:hypothetical protein
MKKNINYTKLILLIIFFKSTCFAGEQLLPVKGKSGKYFYLDINGNNLTPEKYEYAGCFNKGYGVIKENGLFGVIDFSGKEIIEPQFELVSIISENLLSVRKKGLWYFYDKNQILIFDKGCNRYKIEGGNIKVFIGKAEGLLRSNGTIVLPIGSKIKKTEYKNLLFFQYDNKMGLAHRSKGIILQPNFDEITVLKHNNKFLIIASKDKLFGLYEINGKEIINPIFNENYLQLEKNYIWLSDNNNSVGYEIDLGKITRLNNFTNVKSIYPNRYTFKEKSKMGVVDSLGKKIINAIYDKVFVDKEYSNGFNTKLNNKYGLMDFNGAEVIPPILDDIKSVDNFKLTRLNKKYCIYLKNEDRFLKGTDNIDSLFSFKLNYIPFNAIRIDNKWGVLDLNGKKIIDTEFDSISRKFTSDSIVCFKNNLKTTFYLNDNNLSNKRTAKAYINSNLFSLPWFTYIGKNWYFNWANNKYYKLFDKNGNRVMIISDKVIFNSDKYTITIINLADKKENLIYQYYNSFDFVDFEEYDFNQFDLYEGSKTAFGVFDEINNKFIVPTAYKSIKLQINDAVVVCKNENNKYLIYNLDGKVLIENIQEFGELGDGVYSFKQNGKVGFISKEGKIKIKPKFFSATKFVKNRAIVRDYVSNKFGVIDSSDNIIIPLVYDNITFSGSDSTNFLVEKAFNKWGYIYNDGSYSEFSYVNCANIENNFSSVKGFNGKWALFSKYSNKEITSFDYSNIGLMKDNFAPVKFKNFWGAIDSTGNKTIEFKYQEVGNVNCGIIKIKNNNQFGFINLNGEEIVKAKYKKTFDFNSERAIFIDDNQYGFINKNNKIVVKPKFDFISDFSQNGLAIFRSANKFGLIDTSGKIIVKAKYNSLIISKENKYVFKENNLTGFLNNSGEEIFKIKCNKIKYLNDTLVAIKNQDVWKITSTKHKLSNDVLFDFEPQINKNLIFGPLKNNSFVFDNALNLLLKENAEISSALSDNVLKIKYSDSEFNLIDTMGFFLLPQNSKYEINSFQNEFIITKNNNMFSFTHLGELINKSDYIFSDIKFRNKEYLIAKIATLKGLVDYDGNETIPVVYFKLNYLNKIYVGTKGTEVNYYNNNGSLMFK